MLTHDIIKEKLTAKFGDQVYGFTEHYGILTFETPKENNLKVLTFLNDDPELGFTFLNDLTAVHYPQRLNEELSVVYLVQNIKEGMRLRLKVFTPITKPDVYTVTGLFATSNWLEREAYDFFGVNFVGHPNLIRIMNVDEMDYFPLRKEFPLEDQTRIDKDDDMFGR
ncbi:MAG: NADH-quinone oxidoreductase subunit C [Chitinophagaceae bacterium]|nr:NADH-quinone oxidoreductase subunit C [Chitinophagaceae bacterium]